MKDKINKFLEVEDRVFRAPYNFLKEKGTYGGNQMFFGDD